jgi:hypothetical protein
MHLFTRQGRFAPDQVEEGLVYAAALAQYVNQKTGLEVIPWTALYGAPVGTVSWSARVESQAAMGAAGAKLQADTGYRERVSANAHRFEGPVDDALGQILAFSGERPAAPQLATITIAECAGGRLADATAWGVDIMQYSAKVTGAAASVGRGIYGSFGTLVWIALYESLDEVDAADAATSTDPGYLERLDQAGDFFRPGSATQRLIQRIG